MAACVDLESTDGGSHRRNRRRARLGSIVITSSGKVGVWSGRRWIRVGLGPSMSGEARAAAGGHVVVVADG